MMPFERPLSAQEALLAGLEGLRRRAQGLRLEAAGWEDEAQWAAPYNAPIYRMYAAECAALADLAECTADRL